MSRETRYNTHDDQLFEEPIEQRNNQKLYTQFTHSSVSFTQILISQASNSKVDTNKKEEKLKKLIVLKTDHATVSIICKKVYK